MAVSCQLVLQRLREFLPPRFALKRDVTGLQVGTADKTVSRVLCALDLTLEVSQEAAASGAGLVISHHAVIYRPLKQLRTDQLRGKILETLIKNDVAVYVPHTAFDVARGGLNDHLAQAVGLDDAEYLDESGADEAVCVLARLREPEEALLTALRRAGATQIHNAGDEQLEIVAPARRVAAIVRRLDKAARSSPPLVLPLSSHAERRGIGRVGALARAETVAALAARLKTALDCPGVRVVARDLERRVRKVAVLCGDGRSFVDAAIFAGAEALVTGDIDHHTALDARARGLVLIDVGHWASEAAAASLLVQALRERLEGEPVEIVASEIDTQPFSFV